MGDIDTTNDFGVGVQGTNIVMIQPRLMMDRDKALRLAAYIVLMIDYNGRFDQIKDAIAHGD